MEESRDRSKPQLKLRTGFIEGTIGVVLGADAVARACMLRFCILRVPEPWKSAIVPNQLRSCGFCREARASRGTALPACVYGF